MLGRLTKCRHAVHHRDVRVFGEPFQACRDTLGLQKSSLPDVFCIVRERGTPARVVAVDVTGCPTVDEETRKASGGVHGETK
ncbi:hypothetical protein FGU65_01020 [Methanoculleus sp. FWC-SCC1]|uniref:Uncharacterized protein n=1 Tax=Methanoculleus frigidifontis TaxID=2584085 RepID=A0ABT8M6H6_9EURY|nr:hypothetical protein [Methanoculleus sp. FWC-SCC1]MDN7023494.1 hypothetical protein [Methanoculleus sp. FWC-SCC1]